MYQKNNSSKTTMFSPLNILISIGVIMLVVVLAIAAQQPGGLFKTQVVPGSTTGACYKSVLQSSISPSDFLNPLNTPIKVGIKVLTSASKTVCTEVTEDRCKQQTAGTRRYEYCWSKGDRCDPKALSFSAVVISSIMGISDMTGELKEEYTRKCKDELNKQINQEVTCPIGQQVEYVCGPMVTKTRSGLGASLTCSTAVACKPIPSKKPSSTPITS